MTAAASNHQVFTIANAITASRLVAGPVGALLLTTGTQPAIAWALVVMLVAEASDLLDGHVARATAQVSAPGKILDPMADALYRGLIFVAFAFNGWIPLWMVVPIFARDLLVATLREYVMARGIALAARMSGKIKAIIQGVVQIGMVLTVMIYGMGPVTEQIFFALMGITVLVTVYSLVDYLAGVFTAKD